MSIWDQLLVLLLAISYLGAWWMALRIMFGRRFQPLEWIPLAIGALGAPALILETVHDEQLGNWLAGAWAALPIPVILGRLILRRMQGSIRGKIG
jgi:hypothetical protein